MRSIVGGFPKGVPFGQGVGGGTPKEKPHPKTEDAVRVQPGGVVPSCFALRDQGKNLGLGACAGRLVDDFAVLHDNEGGDAHDPEARRQFGLLVHIHLTNLEVSAFRGDFVDDGGYHAAGSAPACPKVNEYGFAFLEDFLVEIIFRNGRDRHFDRSFAFVTPMIPRRKPGYSDYVT
ncbi:hypothetical protein SDC9_122603 [bioreactor metagenome]|uniref:Uncharacterized protein n=1 Tax=bioreactor metagenome TaxID=1076179 RepID=A0A645CF59_9ZZZZ